MSVGLGTLAAQAVPLVATPVLTRMYTPVEFGVCGVFFAIVMTLSLIASGRYELAVPIADEEGEAFAVLVGSLVVLVVVSGVLTVACTIILLAFGLTWLLWSVWFGGGFVLAAGVVQSLSYWFTRHQQYRFLTAARVSIALTSAVVSIVLGYAHPSAGGLAVAATLGQVVGAVLSATIVWPRARALWRDLAWTDVRMALQTHAEFPRVNAPHALVDGLRETGFQALFAVCFGAASTGLYGVAVRVLRAPTSLVGSALGQVMFGRLSRDKREQHDARGFVVRVGSLLAACSFPVFLLIWAFGPQLFGFALGNQWVSAGEFARIMAPGLWLSFVVAPLATLPVVARRMRGAFGFAVTDLVLRVASLGVGLAMRSAEVALWALTLSGVAVSFLLIAWYVRLAAFDTLVRVAFVGQSRWSRVLAEQLASEPRSAVYAAVPLGRPWSVLRIDSIRAVLSADVLVRVGFRPGADTPFGRAFDVVWETLLLFRPSVRAVMYWIGTDVMNTVETLNARGDSKRFRRACSRMRHLAGSQGLVRELAGVGINASVAWFPGLSLSVPACPPALPQDFTVLSYVAEARPEFYGGSQLVEMARALPEIRLRIVGGEGTWAKDVPDNVVFAGWVENMAIEYAKSTVVVRLAEHDALGGTAIEGLLYGRAVVYSGSLEHSLPVAFGDLDGLVETVQKLHEDWREGGLLANERVAEWARQQFSQTERIRALQEELELSV